jgi:hypothetical protein
VKVADLAKKKTPLSRKELEGVKGGGGNIIDSIGSEFAGGNTIDSIGTEFAAVKNPTVFKGKR